MQKLDGQRLYRHVYKTCVSKAAHSEPRSISSSQRRDIPCSGKAAPLRPQQGSALSQRQADVNQLLARVSIEFYLDIRQIHCLVTAPIDEFHSSIHPFLQRSSGLYVLSMTILCSFRGDGVCHGDISGSVH